MAESITPQQDRHDFGHISATVPIPNLLEIQMKSYQTFLQM